MEVGAHNQEEDGSTGHGLTVYVHKPCLWWPTLQTSTYTPVSFFFPPFFLLPPHLPSFFSFSSVPSFPLLLLPLLPIFPLPLFNRNPIPLFPTRKEYCFRSVRFWSLHFGSYSWIWLEIHPLPPHASPTPSCLPSPPTSSFEQQ